MAKDVLGLRLVSHYSYLIGIVPNYLLNIFFYQFTYTDKSYSIPSSEEAFFAMKGEDAENHGWSRCREKNDS